MILTDELRAKYRPTIGIECHVQLKTITKLFAPVDNDARGAGPNERVSVICFGLPGVLPVLNKQAVVLAIRAGKALDAQINGRSSFDRKHYFYPDLPKAYQITQFQAPIVGAGTVQVPTANGLLPVRITRAHLEEDAGKSTHPKGADYSLVDLNRAGTPLLEIVSEPDMHSAEEARAFAHELYLLMKYAQVSDVDLYHGNMRFDVNVSIATVDSEALGLRAEVKNINSFRSVERAVEYEIKRQIELLEAGQTIVQETRGWDEDKGKTLSQRSKENAHDYRYFPDPDIPPLDLEPAFIDHALADLPILPATYRSNFAAIGLESSVIESLLESPKQTAMIQQLLDEQGAEHAKRVALWFVNILRAEEGDPLEDSPATLSQFAELSNLVASNQLSSTAAKDVLIKLVSEGGDPKAIADDLGLIQESNSDTLEPVVKQILDENPQAVNDIQAGQEKAIGFIVGQVMKQTQGRANPALVKDIIAKFLEQ